MTFELEDVGLLVARADKSRCELDTNALSPLGPGETRLRIERFALTTNNVTYAALNQVMPYFEFFPLTDEGRRRTWGRLPAWGFASVIESQIDELPAGTRVFGFLPAARFATIAPTGINASGFRVHQPGLAPEYALYGAYQRTDADPLYLPGREDEVAVFRPLFLTGIVLADYLRSSELAGVDAIVISSASSKTAYGLAAALRTAPGPTLIGLSSERHVPFAASLGVYDQVLGYERLSELPSAAEAVYVDVAGNVAVRRAAAAHLRAVRRFVAVGATHGDAAGYDTRDQNEEVFFAPGWIARRRGELGAAFGALLQSGWNAQMANVGRHFELQRRQGPAALHETYRALEGGLASPHDAYVIDL